MLLEEWRQHRPPRCVVQLAASLQGAPCSALLPSNPLAKDLEERRDLAGLPLDPSAHLFRARAALQLLRGLLRPVRVELLHDLLELRQVRRWQLRLRDEVHPIPHLQVLCPAGPCPPNLPSRAVHPGPVHLPACRQGQRLPNFGEQLPSVCEVDEIDVIGTGNLLRGAGQLRLSVSGSASICPVVRQVHRVRAPPWQEIKKLLPAQLELDPVQPGLVPAP